MRMVKMCARCALLRIGRDFFGHHERKGTVNRKLVIKYAVTLCAAFIAVAPVNALSAQQPVIYLNQAWSQEDREWYYHFSQGTCATVKYETFLNLEAADSQELFRSDSNMARYGFIPWPANSNNPDGLPIGITKTTVTTPIKGWEVGGVYVGLTCSACHQNELTYKGRHVLIDGGNAHKVDMQAFFRAFDGAMQANLADTAKFDRLAARLKADSADAKDKLRKRLESEAAPLHDYTKSIVSPSPWGPGRMDAAALIVNRLTSILPGIPQNWSPGIAPAKPPFLWNASQATWTQWGAHRSDPFARNISETMGVFMPMDLSSKTPAEGLFQSNAAVAELMAVEGLIERLAPPSWPEEVFGKIDRNKAKAGKALFVENCAACHGVWPYDWTEPNKYGKRFLQVGFTPVSYVGTDPTQNEELRRFAVAGNLSPFLPPEVRGKELLPVGTARLNTFIQKLVRDAAIAKANLTEEQKNVLHGYRELPVPEDWSPVAAPLGVWKAAPRDGVWATAPFLHNGAVPNLYEMLIPAAERTKKFYLGGDFDPVKVGLDTKATSGTFLLDTTLLGSSNAGHSFEERPRGNGVIGRLLKEDERWAPIKYLKSIPETPGRVTPNGVSQTVNIPSRNTAMRREAKLFSSAPGNLGKAWFTNDNGSLPCLITSM